MTASRKPDLLIDAFLAEGLTDLPDRTFDAVRGEIHRARQRVVIGPWAAPATSGIARVAIAAAVVLAIGIALGNLGLVLGPAAQPTIRPTPTAPPATIVRPGPLAPGRHALDPDGAAGSHPAVLVSLDDGLWVAEDPAWIHRGEGDPILAPVAFGVRPLAGQPVEADPCGSGGVASPWSGAGAEALLAAIAGQAGVDAGPIETATIDSLRTKVVTLQVTSDGCADIRPWRDANTLPEVGDESRIYVVDVAGTPVTLLVMIPGRYRSDGGPSGATLAPERDMAALEAVLASIEIAR